MKRLRKSKAWREVGVAEIVGSILAGTAGAEPKLAIGRSQRLELDTNSSGRNTWECSYTHSTADGWRETLVLPA